MDNETFRWIIGGICGFLLVAGGGLTAFCFSLNTRMTAMETYIKTSIKGAAEVLHNDDTPKLDALLEKLIEASRLCELSKDEWRQLEELTEKFMNDPQRQAGKRLSASAINALAKVVNGLSRRKFKLTRFLTA